MDIIDTHRDSVLFNFAEFGSCLILCDMDVKLEGGFGYLIVFLIADGLHDGVFLAVAQTLWILTQCEGQGVWSELGIYVAVAVGGHTTIGVKPVPITIGCGTGTDDAVAARWIAGVELASAFGWSTG